MDMDLAAMMVANLRSGNPNQIFIKDRGISSAGRAPALQAGGQRFDPAILHQASRCPLKEDKIQQLFFQFLTFIFFLDNKIGGFGDSRSNVRVSKG